ncbi:MAG: flagellar motor switch protein FliN [Pyrinomonadaceae bacterium]
MQQQVTPVNFERLYDVEMNVTVRFGKTQMPLRDVVRFGVGSMIELNRTVDEPVELLVNDSPFAHGEVVVIDGYYGVRITDIGSEEDRSRKIMSEPTPMPAPEQFGAPAGTLADEPAEEPIADQEETGEVAE